MELAEKEKTVLQRMHQDVPGEREPRFTVLQFLEAAGLSATDEEEMVIAHQLKDQGLATVQEDSDSIHGRYLIALTGKGEELASQEGG